VKLVATEPGSDEARTHIKESLEKGYTLYTVNMALAEGLNAIWKHVKIHKDLNLEDANSTIQDLTNVYSKLKILTIRELCEQASKIAFTYNTTIYDALYVAAAEKVKATLYTADQKFHNKAKKVISSELLKPS